MPVSTAGIAVKNGKFLLALRKPGTTIGSSWEFPGGKAEPGESPENALVREFREELQIDITVGRRLCGGTFRNGSREYEIFAFSIDLASEKYVLDEHSSIGWFTLNEMDSLQMADSDRKIVSCLRLQFPKE